LVNGFIDPQSFAGGEVTVSQSLAERAIEDLGGELGLSMNEAAAGIIRVTTSNLVAEFTRLCAKYGIDAREFTLMPFGGAGATHACFLADELPMRRIAIPIAPGTFCALGSVLADFRLDYLKTAYAPLSRIDSREVDEWYESVEAEGRKTLSDVIPSVERWVLNKTADVRYVGQGFELEIPFRRLADLPDLFKAEYQRKYGARQIDVAVEIINLRATLVGEIAKPSLARPKDDPAPTSPTTRRVYMNGWREVPVYRRESLATGWSAKGPFIVDQNDTTCVISEGWRVQVDEFGTLLLEKQ
jgi:N-methylhydantoinase A